MPVIDSANGDLWCRVRHAGKVTSSHIDARWWEFLVRGAMLRGTTQCRQPGSATVAVVAIHGGPGIDGGGLRHVLASMADHTQLVVPDLRGHGRSELGTPSTWTLDDWADDLAELVNVLGLERPVVAGVSFGGWVALRYAARHPDQPRALVVAATSARLPSIEQTAQRMRYLGGPASAAAWVAIHTDPVRRSREQYAKHVVPLMSVRPVPADLAAVRSDQITTPKVDEHFAPLFSQLDLTDDARQIRCPVTVILGERDPLTTPELARSTAQACAEPARLRVLPNVAHDLLVDAPDTLINEIKTAASIR